MAAKSKTDDAPEDPPPPPPPPESGEGDNAGSNDGDANKSSDGANPAKSADGANGNGAAKGANVDKAAGISTAKGTGTSALGDQVHPATQTSEKDGARTLVNPKTDPGPFVKEGRVPFRNPDRSKGEHRYSDCNEPIKVLQRTSTGHDMGFARPDGDVTSQVDLHPDVYVSGAASDVYNKEQGEGLTDVAKAKAAEGRELAPTHE